MTLDWRKLRGVYDRASLPIRPAILVDRQRVRVLGTWDTSRGTMLLDLSTLDAYDRAPWTPFGVPVFVRRVEAP